MKQPCTLPEIGLPVDTATTLHSLLYNAPADVLIAVLQPRRFIQNADQRVFLRTPVNQRYRQVVIPGQGAFITNVAVSADAPLLFINASQWATGAGGDASFLGIFRVLLPGSSVELLPPPIIALSSQSTLGATATLRGLSALMGASSDGAALHVICRCEVPDGTAKDYQYWLGTYHVQDGTVEPTAELPAVFA